MVEVGRILVTQLLFFVYTCRSELKERRQEVSVLQQQNLEKDFQLKEMKQTDKQHSTLIQLKEKDETELREK